MSGPALYLFEVSHPDYPTIELPSIGPDSATVEAIRRWGADWKRVRLTLQEFFERLGGDCTNFVSQCLFAGCGVMNFAPVFGWYYRSANDRTASWTGVEFLYNFLTANDGAGPYAEEIPLVQLQPGDVIQLGRTGGDFYHSLLAVGFFGGVPLVAAHSFDAYARPLSSYSFERMRAIHILGARAD